MTSTGHHVKDFHVGQHVKYIPNHANNNPEHEECENGIVSSLNTYVHVRFFRRGILQSTAECCESDNLIPL